MCPFGYSGPSTNFFQTYGDFGTKSFVTFRRIYEWSDMRRIGIIVDGIKVNPLGKKTWLPLFIGYDGDTH